MKTIYEVCPVFENETLCLMQTEMEDANGLLACYSDKEAVPFFNADNCHGDTFYYDTLERMEQAIKFWCESYELKAFVRWTILLKATNEKIGTIEMFNRGMAKDFGMHGILRIDLQSKYEKSEIIESILDIANESSRKISLLLVITMLENSHLQSKQPHDVQSGTKE